MQIKNKDDELQLQLDNITNLNKNIESLQLKLDKEIAERKRLDEELSKMNNECKVWTSEKSAFERQVGYLTKYLLYIINVILIKISDS